MHIHGKLTRLISRGGRIQRGRKVCYTAPLPIFVNFLLYARRRLLPSPDPSKKFTYGLNILTYPLEKISLIRPCLYRILYILDFNTLWSRIWTCKSHYTSVLTVLTYLTGVNELKTHEPNAVISMLDIWIRWKRVHDLCRYFYLFDKNFVIFTICLALR